MVCSAFALMNEPRPRETPQIAASHQSRRPASRWLILGAVGPAAIVALSILWFGDFTPKVSMDADARSSSAARSVSSCSAREHVVRPLQTMTNLLAALARRRLLDSRARRARRRRARRSAARNQCARRNLAHAASRRIRSDRAFCARSWRRSMSAFSLSIPIIVCVW